MRSFCCSFLALFFAGHGTQPSSAAVYAAFASTHRSTCSNLESSFALSTLGNPVCEYHQLVVPTSRDGPPRQEISVEDLTPTLVDLIKTTGMSSGIINVISRHTTTAITINERESRLERDLSKSFLALFPPDERSEASTAKEGVRYFHNDIDQRPESEEETQRCRDNGWNIDDIDELERWRAQEPINAHSHLIAMLLGSSECIPVVDGAMVIGQWQSVMLVDLDGPRERTIGVQLQGYK